MIAYEWLRKPLMPSLTGSWIEGKTGLGGIEDPHRASDEIIHDQVVGKQKRSTSSCFQLKSKHDNFLPFLLAAGCLIKSHRRLIVSLCEHPGLGAARLSGDFKESMH